MGDFFMDNVTLQTLVEQIADLKALIQELKNDNELLREENKYLKRKLFGTKSEKSSSLGIDQLSLFDQAEQESNQKEIEEIIYNRNKKTKKRDVSIKLDSLPQKDVLLDLNDDEKVCPRCNSQLKAVGKELVRREVKFIPARLEVVNIYRTTYECRKCRKSNLPYMFGQPAPTPVIPHSYASAESVAYAMAQKYINGVPLYRQEGEWKHLGLDIPRATLANWIIIAAKEYLIPLKEYMHQMLLEGKYIHADETSVKVLNEPGKKNTSNSYMWVYANIKESEKAIRIFEYKPSRSADNPKEFLKGFTGTIITDGYSVYKTLEGVSKTICWAHARRKFRDALGNDIEASDTISGVALNKIKKLFEIEKDIEDMTAEEKGIERQKRSKPLLDDFFSWCDENIDKCLKGSKLFKAFQYALNHKEGLCMYVEDGYIPMTNSLDERTIRPFAIGRNYVLNSFMCC